MESWKIYAHEAITQLEFAKRSYDSFLQAEIQNDISSIFFHLHHFVVHVAQVDKLLNVGPESKRGVLLNSHINISNVDLRQFRKLRNHLEHFDERLDLWVREHEGHAFFDMNIVTGTKAFPAIAYLRALDGHVYKFHGEDYALNELAESVNLLHASLENSVGHVV